MKKIILIMLPITILIIGIIIYLYINKQSSITTLQYIENNNIIEQKPVGLEEESNEKVEEPIIIVLNEKKCSNEVAKIENEYNSNLQEVQQDNITTVEENNEIQTTENSQEQNKYYIKVNYQENIVIVYEPDENENYTIPFKIMLCSTGTSTPKSGTYNLKAKYRWLSLVGGVYGQYCTQINGNILFHSVPYTEKGNKSSLEYWEYDKLGTTCSAGCVRLTVVDAKWIYDNCTSETLVEFYASDNMENLQKPETIKISDYINYRGWDPTDEDENNPWINFAEI